MAIRQKHGVPVKPYKFDPNPIFACQVIKDEETGIGTVKTWMSFDPRYGPESERQIEWHIQHDTPGATTWEVGVPCDGPGFNAKKTEEASA